MINIHVFSMLVGERIQWEVDQLGVIIWGRISKLKRAEGGIESKVIEE